MDHPAFTQKTWLGISPVENGLRFCRCDSCSEDFFQWLGQDVSAADLPHEALKRGWTTDGELMHCQDCPPLELSGIVQAAMMIDETRLAHLCRDPLAECGFSWDELTS